MPNRSLLIMPDDGVKPLLNAIEAARKNIRVKMFIFSDPDLLQAVIAGKNRGLDVRVMLNPARRDGVAENEETRKTLEAAGIKVMDSNPEFGITHEKSMVIDDKIAYIKSLNWETKNLTETRDYVIITTQPQEVKEVMECFDADWDRHKFNSDEKAHLIWCTGNGRTKITEFINNAKDTLFIQNERFQDIVVIERIVRAASRGVKVHVMVAPPERLKKGKLIEEVSGLQIMNDYGIKIHELRHMKLHGKMLIADGKKAIIGSINFAPGSFDDRRELAIEVDDKAIISRLRKIAKFDWKNSSPFDLSDKSLKKDLAKHGDKKEVKKLALDDDSGGKDKHKVNKNKKSKH